MFDASKERPLPTVPLTPEDEAFLATYDPTAFPRPSVAVDVVLLTAERGALHAALIHRDQPPYRGAWSLPGVFVALDEALEDAAARALRKTGLRTPVDALHLEQLYTFGEPGRDPRGRVISVAYFALVPPDALSSLAEGARRQPVAEIGPLAFDHGRIVEVAVERLRGKLGWTDVGFALLPERFTLRDLQVLHEAILGRPLNKDSFRRRMLATGLLVPTGEREGEVGHRPAALYRFDSGGRDG